MKTKTPDEKYLEDGKKFIALRESGAEIKPENTMAWQEWRRYFSSRGISKQLSIMDKIERKIWASASYTVPSENPQDFDAHA